MIKKWRYFLVMVIGIFASMTWAYTEAEVATNIYLDKIKFQRDKLDFFLKDMPKGGDLHNHLMGAGLAENMIDYAKNDNFCIDKTTFEVYLNPNCSQELHLKNAIKYAHIYDPLIEAWSMRNFKQGKESGHAHFFATFKKFEPVYTNHSGKVLSEVVNKAGAQQEIYLELMVTPDNNMSGQLGKDISFDTDFAALRQKLLTPQMKEIITMISHRITQDEKVLKNTLDCDAAKSQKGCDVTVRYLYQALREQPPTQVFAQLLAGFEAATQDPRIVGINLVQPEDGHISMRDYDLHMKMIGFLHTIYPNVAISLHAGELTPALVPQEGLQNHIRDAINIGQAQRIGHGVDILYEKNAHTLLKEMAENQILVEINLISNKAILNVSGNKHPFLSYLAFGVPLALSTDDEGVLRTNLTAQYKSVILMYKLSYFAIKDLIRNSITYSFLPGASLWQDNQYLHRVEACQKEDLQSVKVSTLCAEFLKENEKAALQWKLEKQLSHFENQYLLRVPKNA